jgi:2-iminobutanoate/2-iminopropanoate deaminase
VTAKKPIRTSEAPKAIGPYSQGVRSGDLAFTSGQIPLPPSGELIPDDIARAARQALDNALAVLAAGGAGPADVVKVTVYLANMSDFAAVNAVYGEVFEAPYPARSCVEVARLPKNAPIMIDAIARIDPSEA